jgi:tripartite-type tricarboxylate transporter receptor subunit TctC
LATTSLGNPGKAAADYPDRPVRIVVPNSPGGPSDLIARHIAPGLQSILGGSFVVENRGGAGGNIGMGAVARADADGYTLLLSTSAYVVNPSLYDKLPYDPFKSFAPIAELASSPNAIAIHPKVGANTMKELVVLMKKQPEKLNIATPPIGTTPQLAAEVLKLKEKLPTVAIVVHTGGGMAVQSVLTGTVQISIGALASAHAQIVAGNLKALAVTGDSRWHDLKDVPTMVELGYKDFVSETYTALSAPAATPKDIVAKLEKAALQTLADPKLQERLLKSGFKVEAKDGKGHMARIVKEVPMWRGIIGEAGIKRTKK